jgi:outer membrane protein W
VKFAVGPTVGLTVPAGDYAGETYEYYVGTKYGLGTGFNVGAVLKARLLVLNIRAGLTYTSLSNTGIAELDEPGTYVEVKQNLVTIFAGPEYHFQIPASPVKPYIGADLLFTSFSGHTTFNEPVDRVPTGTYNMSTATRIGIGLGAGVEFGLGKTYALDFSIKYNLLNLIGKNYDVIVTDPARLHAYINLNDDRDPLSLDNNHPIVNSRSISTLQFNLAFLFGL